MSEGTKIQWTDNSGGPWMICDPVSPGCANCYAWELMERRLFPIIRKAYKAAGLADWETRPVWGKSAPRVLTKGFWTQIIASDKAAAKRGERVKSFPSMIDWLDDMPAGIIDQDGKWLEPIAVLADFLDVIRRTPNTDHLLLTKRPENWAVRVLMAAMYSAGFRDGQTGGQPVAETHQSHDFISDWAISRKPPANVWIGATVENQEYADKRIPALLEIPAVCRFLSVEPMLGPIEFSNVTGRADAVWQLGKQALSGIHWVICGGESGAKARGFDVGWARSVVEQCQRASVPVPVFVKQLGAKPYDTDASEPLNGTIAFGLNLKDKKGGDMSEWLEDLRVREFPIIRQ